MKRAITFMVFVLLFLATNGIAQDYVFDEEFNNNYKGWPVTKSGDIERNIRNGKYIWDGSGSSLSSNWELVEMTLDQSRDFALEMSIKKSSGPESEWGVGLIWGDMNNRFSVFGSTGKYAIIDNIYGRNPSDYINTGNTINKLTVKKMDRKLKFYMNDNYLGSGDFKSFSPSKIGVYLYMDNIRIEIDYIRAYYLSSESNNNNNDNNVLKEDFSNNSNGWYEGESTDYSFKVKNGKYVYQRFAEDAKGTSWANKTSLDYDKNFTIETTINKISGIQDYGYGLLFGYKDVDNMNAFLLSGNGYFKISGWNNTTESKHYAWTTSSYINQGNGSVNGLKIVKTGSDYKFYINDNYVATVSDINVPGTKVGYIIYKNQKVEIDNLYISYNINDQNNKKVIKSTEERQDKSLFGPEAVCVYEFLEIWIDDASNDDKLMNFISPKYLNKNNLNKSEYNVNLYYPVNFKIKSIDKENSLVTALIWGEDKKWIHKLTFKVVREDGKLYVYPSQYTTSMYIYPWSQLESNVSE